MPDDELDIDALFSEDEVAPKRRGRPKGSKNVKSEDKAPATRRGRKSFRESIGAQLSAINQLLLSFNGTRVYALTDIEGNMLVDGLDKVQQEDPRVKKYLQTSGKYGAYATLIAAFGVYSLRVLGDLGYIPKPGQVKYDGSEIRPGVYVCEFCGQPAVAGWNNLPVCSDHLNGPVSVNGATEYAPSVNVQ